MASRRIVLIPSSAPPPAPPTPDASVTTHPGLVEDLVLDDDMTRSAPVARFAAPPPPPPPAPAPAQALSPASRLRVFRFRTKGVRVLLSCEPLLHCFELSRSQSDEAADPDRWEYYLILGDSLGPRIARKDLKKLSDFGLTHVVFLAGSRLLFRGLREAIDAGSTEIDASLIRLRCFTREALNESHRVVRDLAAYERAVASRQREGGGLGGMLRRYVGTLG